MQRASELEGLRAGIGDLQANPQYRFFRQCHRNGNPEGVRPQDTGFGIVP